MSDCSSCICKNCSRHQALTQAVRKEINFALARLEAAHPVEWSPFFAPDALRNQNTQMTAILGRMSAKAFLEIMNCEDGPANDNDQ